MPIPSREQVLFALNAYKERRSEDISTSGRRNLHGLLLAATVNYEKGLATYPRFVRAYQPSYTPTIGKSEITYTPADLSSYLRLDIGDGGSLIGPTDGLVRAAGALEPHLMSYLDELEISDLVRTSAATGLKVRIRADGEIGAEKIGRASRDSNGAQLVGEIAMNRNYPGGRLLVDLATTLSMFNTGFVLKHVGNAADLALALGHLADEELMPESIDIDRNVLMDLGAPSYRGRMSSQTVREIVDVVLQNDITNTITATALSSSSVRSVLFGIVEKAGFPVESVCVSGRDLMPETVDLDYAGLVPVREPSISNVLAI